MVTIIIVNCMPILIALESLYGGSNQPAIKLQYLINPESLHLKRDSSPAGERRQIVMEIRPNAQRGGHVRMNLVCKTTKSASWTCCLGGPRGHPFTKSIRNGLVKGALSLLRSSVVPISCRHGSMLLWNWAS